MCYGVYLFLGFVRLKVRAQSVFFDVQDNVPDWVLALSGDELRSELDKHLLYMCNITLGK